MSSNGNGNGNNSRSNGSTSQPSSILFFVAVAIGVLIALVFIFFSMRYYVRTRLGIYATARITTTNNNGVVLLTGDLPMQTFNSYNPDISNQLRRRRRRRYTKKRRLTEEEVDHLFPLRTYQDWLEGGAERDIEGRDIHEQLKEEDDEEILQNDNESNENVTQAGSSANQLESDTTTTLTPTPAQTPDSTTETATTSKTATDKLPNNDDTLNNDDTVINESTTAALEEAKPTLEHVDLGNPLHEELHYDSGTCAICIDTFEPEDTVRGLICGHVFHQDCLDPWLIKRKACCPMCKRDYYLKKQNAEGETVPDDDQMDLNSLNHYTTALQYTTLSERVAEIVARDPSIEERAKQSIEKYLSLKWRFFWFVMGISRTDLIHSAIVSEDQRSRDGSANQSVEAANGSSNTADTGNEQTRPEAQAVETSEQNNEASRARAERMV